MHLDRSKSIVKLYEKLKFLTDTILSKESFVIRKFGDGGRMPFNRIYLVYVLASINHELVGSGGPCKSPMSTGTTNLS